MATLSQYAFIPRSIQGSMVGASEVQPTGTNGYLYYDIVKDVTASAPASVTNISANLNGYQGGSGSGKRCGVVVYDYINARWTALWTQPNQQLVSNGWINDKGAITDFCASLATPQTIEEVSGDQLAYPASIAPLAGG